MNIIQKSMFMALIALSTASVYYAQSVKDTLGKEQFIDEVVISGVADIAKDRKTPVAVSTITEAQIVERLGNQEFPEILNTTPSVYATKGGGGFGDSTLNIRGFSQANIAVMINGVPVNDMENGAVFWSNWAGLSDVTSALQVQRGLGSSKLAIASVGGTVNIITRAADRKEGGKVSLQVGNDGYVKNAISYNSGKNSKGWSSSFLLSRTGGSTYASGTHFEGYNYYFALGWQPNAKHDFQFTFTGAPQYHNQRAFEINLSTLIKNGSIERPDRKYNAQEGVYHGQEFNTKRNYYHKPVISLNWDWKLSPSSKISTVAYASFGRGAGTANTGSSNGKVLSAFQPLGGLINFDAIAASNAASTSVKGVLIRNTSVNSHNWFGLISNFNHKINDNLNFSFGIDTRYYHGYHYTLVSDLLGASEYRDSANKNLWVPNTDNVLAPGYNNVANSFKANPDFNPFGGKINNIQDKITFSNDGQVIWYGGFGQIEYANDKISAFLQGAVSNQGFQRIDNFIIDGISTLNGLNFVGYRNPASGITPLAAPYVATAANPALYAKTGYKFLVGYNTKGGVNYNIDDHSNVFVNAGYYSKQPFLNAVYPNNKNYLNPNLTNEKILGFEGGYGFKASWLNAKLNVYNTNWKDQFKRVPQQIVPAGGGVAITAYANISGITEVHRGVELEANSRVNKFLTINTAISVANWFYKGNAKGGLFNEANDPIDSQGNIITSGTVTQTLYLDKIKVGNAAQTTASAGINIQPVRDFRFDATYRYVNHLYANLNIADFANQTKAAKGALELPNYGLFELGASYKFRLPNPKQSFTIRGNIYNLLDTYYIQNSYTNTFAGDSFSTGINYKGIDTGNQVFFGFGRTWSTSVVFNF